MLYWYRLTLKLRNRYREGKNGIGTSLVVTVFTPSLPARHSGKRQCVCSKDWSPRLCCHQTNQDSEAWPPASAETRSLYNNEFASAWTHEGIFPLGPEYKCLPIDVCRKAIERSNSGLGGDKRVWGGGKRPRDDRTLHAARRESVQTGGGTKIARIKGVIVFRFELGKIKIKKSERINFSWDVLNIYSALACCNF